MPKNYKKIELESSREDEITLRGEEGNTTVTLSAFSIRKDNWPGESWYSRESKQLDWIKRRLKSVYPDGDFEHLEVYYAQSPGPPRALYEVSQYKPSFIKHYGVVCVFSDEKGFLTKGSQYSIQLRNPDSELIRLVSDAFKIKPWVYFPSQICSYEKR